MIFNFISNFLMKNQGIKKAKIKKFFLIIRFVHAELRSPYPIFDEHYYKKENPDTSDLPGLIHYVLYGHAELRSPHPRLRFDRVR